MNALGEYAEKARTLKDQYDRACQRIEEEEAAAILAREDELAATEARVILQHVSQEVQQRAHDRISSVVSRCLEAVFQDPYEFHIEFDRKRGKTEARLVFTRAGNEVHPTMGASGGVREVAGLALRIACLLLTRPALRPVIVADEPFTSVHGEGNRKRLRQLLEALPGELGIQIILVTGLEWLRCGTIVEV